MRSRKKITTTTWRWKWSSAWSQNMSTAQKNFTAFNLTTTNYNKKYDRMAFQRDSLNSSIVFSKYTKILITAYVGRIYSTECRLLATQISQRLHKKNLAERIWFISHPRGRSHPLPVTVWSNQSRTTLLRMASLATKEFAYYLSFSNRKYLFDTKHYG